MAITPLPSNAQLHYKPADHSWVEVDGSIPFYAQAVSPVNQFQIPPYNRVEYTNNGDGNPTTIVYKKDGNVVAQLDLTYDGTFVTSIVQSV